MKKFLIAVLVFVPVIIFISLSLTGSIISATILVNAEDIILKDYYDQLLDLNKTYTIDLIGDEMLIQANVVPNISYSKEIIFISQPNGNYGGEVTVIPIIDEANNKFRIVPTMPGAVNLIIHALNNVNARKVISIYVTTNKVSEINIYHAGELKEADETISITNKTKLYADCYPVEAIGQNIISWHSSNEDVITVDSNGVLQINKKGITQITASVEDLEGNLHYSHSLNVTSNSALVKENNINILSDNNNEIWIRDNLLLNSSYNISTMMSSNEKSVYNVNDGINFIELTAINVADNSWDVTNYDYIEHIYIDNGGYFIEVKYLNYENKSSTLPFTVISSDNSILEVDSSGRLIPKKQGVATLTITALGQQKFIDIEVKSRLNTFSLNLTELDNKVGIKQERVWAINWIKEDNTLSHATELSLRPLSAVYKGNRVDNPQLAFSSSSNDYVDSCIDGNIVFNENALGKEVTITANEVIHNYKTRVKNQYTYKILDYANAVNIESHAKEKLTDYANMGYGIVLHAPIFLSSTLYVSNSLWGNGYLVDTQDFDTSRANAAVYISNTSEVHNDEIYFENINFKGSSSYENSKDRGTALMIADMQQKVYVRFIDVRYFNHSLHLTNNHNLTVESSLLGDCFQTAIFSENNYGNDNYLGIKNCVFKPTNSASISIGPRGFITDVTVTYMPKIEFSGFIDSYNWLRTENLSNIIDSFSEDDFSALPPGIGINQVKGLLDWLLGDLFETPGYRHLYYTDEKNNRYVSLAAFIIGLWSEVDISNITTNLDDMIILELAMPKANSGLIGNILKAAEEMTKLKFSHSCYLLSYEFENNKPRILPNTPCPTDETLLKRLQNL